MLNLREYLSQSIACLSGAMPAPAPEPSRHWENSLRAQLVGVCMVNRDQLRELALAPAVTPALVRHGDIRNFIQYELLGVVSAVHQLDSPKFNYLKSEVARQIAVTRGFAGMARHCNTLIESMSVDVDARGALRMGESLRAPLDAAVENVSLLLDMMVRLQEETPASNLPIIAAFAALAGQASGDVVSHAWNGLLDFNKAAIGKDGVDERAALESSGANNLTASVLFSSAMFFGAIGYRYCASHRELPLADLVKSLHQLKSALYLVSSCLGNAEALQLLCVDIRAVLAATQSQNAVGGQTPTTTATPTATVTATVTATAAAVAAMARAGVSTPSVASVAPLAARDSRVLVESESAEATAPPQVLRPPRPALRRSLMDLEARL